MLIVPRNTPLAPWSRAVCSAIASSAADNSSGQPAKARRASDIEAVLATLLGLCINLAGVPPFTMLYYTAVLNGVVMVSHFNQLRDEGKTAR